MRRVRMVMLRSAPTLVTQNSKKLTEHPGIWIFYIWQFLLTLRHSSPLLACAQICPVAVSGVLAAVATGFLLSRLHPAMVMTIALTAFTIGSILLATAPIGQTYWAQIFLATIIMPW